MRSAVATCTSTPARNARRNASSPETCASQRSSAWPDVRVDEDPVRALGAQVVLHLGREGLGVGVARREPAGVDPDDLHVLGVEATVAPEERQQVVAVGAEQLGVGPERQQRLGQGPADLGQCGGVERVGLVQQPAGAVTPGEAGLHLRRGPAVEGHLGLRLRRRVPDRLDIGREQVGLTAAGELGQPGEAGVARPAALVEVGGVAGRVERQPAALQVVEEGPRRHLQLRDRLQAVAGELVAQHVAHPQRLDRVGRRVADLLVAEVAAGVVGQLGGALALRLDAQVALGRPGEAVEPAEAAEPGVEQGVGQLPVPPPQAAVPPRTGGAEDGGVGHQGVEGGVPGVGHEPVEGGGEEHGGQVAGVDDPRPLGAVGAHGWRRTGHASVPGPAHGLRRHRRRRSLRRRSRCRWPGGRHPARRG